MTQYNLKGDNNKLKIHIVNPKATNENIKHELYAANKQIKETNGNSQIKQEPDPTW